jgi:hypothetical protein
MADPIRKGDQVTSADLAGRRRDFAGRPNPEIETPDGPRLVEDDLRNQSIQDEFAASDLSDTRHRAWDTSRPVLETTSPDESTLHAPAPLFSDAEVIDFRSRWSDVQAGFVDQPRRSVQQADQLVATVMQRLAQGFANERESLEGQWDSGDNVSTEDLRVALQRYRTFFGKLLNAA